VLLAALGTVPFSLMDPGVSFKDVKGAAPPPEGKQLNGVVPVDVLPSTSAQVAPVGYICSNRLESGADSTQQAMAASGEQFVAWWLVPGHTMTECTCALWQPSLSSWLGVFNLSFARPCFHAMNHNIVNHQSQASEAKRDYQASTMQCASS
jgi:hypothetical protein